MRACWIVVIAACSSAPRVPKGEPTNGSAAAPDPPHPAAPDRAVDLPHACNAVADGIRGLPPPNPQWVDFLAGHRWCHGDRGEWLTLDLRADGRVHAARGIAPSGREPTTCWGLSGEEILIDDGSRWNVYKLRRLDARWQIGLRVYEPCPDVPPPPDPTRPD